MLAAVAATAGVQVASTQRALARLCVFISTGRKGIHHVCKEPHWRWGSGYLGALLPPAVLCSLLLVAKQVSVWAGCVTHPGPHQPGQCMCLPGKAFPPSELRNELRWCWWRCWRDNSLILGNQRTFTAVSASSPTLYFLQPPNAADIDSCSPQQNLPYLCAICLFVCLLEFFGSAFLISPWAKKPVVDT